MGKIELNNRQRAIASRVIKSVKAGTQILAFVTGRAGTGKSILIKYIYKRTENDGAVRCAMTNRAARNIGGMTLHAAFGWPLTRRIKNPQAPAHRARLIIIDEVSMMSASMLADVESQLRGRGNLPFGGKSILLVGDFNQLPPVQSAIAYKSHLWFHFRECAFQLDDNMRQREQDFDAACIGYIVNGDVADTLAACKTSDSIEVVTKRIIDAGNIATTQFIFFRNVDVDSQNLLVAKMLKLRAVSQKSIIRCKKEDSEILETDVFYIGGRYTATSGAGRLRKGEMYTLESTSDQRATLVDNSGERISVGQVPVQWFLNGKPATKRTLPIRLGFASTVHKAQGMSFDHVVVNPAFMGRQLFYVAISRCKSQSGLSILGDIPTSPFNWSGIQLEIFGDSNVEPAPLTGSASGSGQEVHRVDEIQNVLN